MKFIEPFGAAPGSRYVDRDTPGAIVGSKIPADFPNTVMDELVSVIAKSAMTPDDVLQLAAAIRSQRLNYFQATGTANALAIAPDPVITDYADLIGVPIRIKPSALNTGAATLNVNGLGNKAIRNPDGTAIASGRLFNIFEVVYTGTDFIITSAPRPATQAEVDAGVSDVGYITPLISAKKKASYMAAVSGSQSIPSGVFTTFTSFGVVATHFQGASSFASGILTIASGDEGLWYLGFSARQSGLGTVGQSTQITVNGVAVASDGAQTSGSSAVGHSSPSVAAVLNVGDVVAFQVIQSTGGSVTFTSYNLSAARIGAS
jgi:hypothetical protein